MYQLVEQVRSFMAKQRIPVNKNAKYYVRHAVDMDGFKVKYVDEQ